jgi:hypothetical protein
LGLQKYLGAPFRSTIFQTPRFGLLGRGVIRFALHTNRTASVWSALAMSYRFGLTNHY